MNAIVQKVILATTENVVGFVAYSGGMVLLTKVAPKIFAPSESSELKDQMKFLVRTLGITIAMAIITGMIASQAKSLVEGKFFPKIEINDIS